MLQNKRVIKVLYKSSSIRWQNGWDGSWHVHHPDFYIEWDDGYVEHVEIIEKHKQMPLTKFLYAQNQLTNWRMATRLECDALAGLTNFPTERQISDNWW